MYKTITGNIFFYCNLLVAFLIPLSQKPAVFSIMLLVLAWIISGEWLKTFRNAIRNTLFIIFITFFLLHLTGLFYTANIHSGWFDIEVKLSLLLFPLIFFLSGSLNKKKREIILKVYIAGTVVAMIICIVNAFISYKTLNADVFYYSSLSVFHHPAYFAMYICFSAAIIVHWLLNEGKFLFLWFRILLLLILIISAVFIYMLSSKAGIIVFFITLFTLSIPALLHKKKRMQALFIMLFAGFQIWFSLTQNLRFQVVVSSVQAAEKVVTTEESTGVRVLVYEAAIDLITKNYIMGVGTGDIKDELMKEYRVREMTGALENKLNAHNQFLETWLGQGLAGITLLFILFLIPFINSFRNRKWLLMSFVIIIGTNFMFESMLNTQAGVVFFAFFYNYFVTEPDEK